MLTVNMTKSVTEQDCKSVVDFLTLSSLRHLNDARAKAGKPPVTPEQQIKLFGRVID